MIKTYKQQVTNPSLELVTKAINSFKEGYTKPKQILKGRVIVGHLLSLLDVGNIEEYHAIYVLLRVASKGTPSEAIQALTYIQRALKGEPIVIP